MQKIKLFHGDFLEWEEIGTHYMDYVTYLPEGSVETLIINRPSTPEVKFKSFLDGTMKIYRVARATHLGTPLFVASISCALLERGKDRHLKNTHYSRTLNLLIFPFERFVKYIERTLPQMRDEIKRLIEDLQFHIKIVVRSLGRKVYSEEEFAENPKKVFEKSENWVICDTSKEGIIRSGNERDFVKEIELYNPQRVRDAARARARYFMGLLEFYCAYSYLKERPQNYLMIDGLFYPYRKVGGLFGITWEEYMEKIGRVIGFIKHPRDIPSAVFSKIPFLGENECLHWIGKPSEAEEDTSIKIENIKKIGGKDRFRFALLRFRIRGKGFYPTPIGVVKLQISPEHEEHEELRKIIEAVLYENLPLPTDRRRLYNEPYPIEVAERVAKAFLPSEERIIGFVYSIVGGIE